MSVCRFWWDGSDVYVYFGSRGWECCGCKLGNDNSFGDDEEAMVAHLDRHVGAGHVVPTYAYEAFGAKHPDEDDAQRAASEWLAANPKYAPDPPEPKP
jgi:hypothetical protein